MTHSTPERTDGAARRQALEALDTLEQAAIGYCHLYERGDSARAARIAGMEMLAKSIRAALSALPAGQGSATALRDARPEPPYGLREAIRAGLRKDCKFNAVGDSVGTLTIEGCVDDIAEALATLPAQAAPAHQGSATEQYVSNVEARELMDILRTLTPSGTALITSARELVRLYEQLKAAPAPAGTPPVESQASRYAKNAASMGFDRAVLRFYQRGPGDAPGNGMAYQCSECEMHSHEGHSVHCTRHPHNAPAAPAGTPDTLDWLMDDAVLRAAFDAYAEAWARNADLPVHVLDRQETRRRRGADAMRSVLHAAAHGADTTTGGK